jgi:hypothetical protein
MNNSFLSYNYRNTYIQTKQDKKERNWTSNGSCLWKRPILSRRAVSRLIWANYGMDCRLRFAETKLPVSANLVVLLHFVRF